MNFSQTLDDLKSASAFELFRLRAAIDRVLDQPDWLQAVQSRLRVGQTVTYFDVQKNCAQEGMILEMRRKQVVIFEAQTQQRWLLSYASINLDGADITIREQTTKGLGRNEVAIGDRVGFVARDKRERAGKITRLNDKTVTMLCDDDQRQWRVGYRFLYRIVDSAEINLKVGVVQLNAD